MKSRSSAYVFPLWAAVAGVVSSTPAAAADKPKMAVLPMTASEISEDSVAILEELVMNTIHGLDRYRVIGASDIKAMLGLDRLKAAVGCNDSSCMAEIGGALGVDYLVAGRVGKFGEELIVTIKMIDIRTHEIPGRAELKLKDERTLYSSAIEHAVSDLFGKQPPKGVEDNQEWRDFFAYRGQALLAGTKPQPFSAWLDENRRGSIRVTSEPLGASVFLNGEYSGPTPRTLRNQVPGTYAVKLTKKDYATIEREVMVDVGSEVVIDERLISLVEYEDLQSSATAKTIVGWTSIGLAAAALAGGGIALGTARTEEEINADEYEQYLQTGTGYDQVRAAAEQRNTQLIVGYALAGAGAVLAGIGIWALATIPDVPDVGLSVDVSADAAAFTLGGRF